MALDAGTLIFRVFEKDDPLGTALGNLDNAYGKSVTVEDNGVGSGSFSIHPDDTGAAWCEQDNYVAVWRDTVSGDPIAGFWIDTVNEVVLSPDEGGGREVKVSGRGPIAILEEALVWHKAKSGTPAVVYPAKGEWRWKNVHPARPLVRLIEEAKERGALADVTLDFSRTTDSDGTPWATDLFDEFAIAIGTNILDVIRVLREAGLYITMTPGLVLRAWESYGSDLSGSIGFTEGVDIRDTSEMTAAARRGKSAILVQGENRNDQDIYSVVLDSAYETELGRRKESFFGFQKTATAAILKKVGRRKLDKYKKQYDGPFTLGVIDTTDQVALVDYTVGDTVAVPAEYTSAGKERIAAITLADIDNGEYDPTIEFGEVTADSSMQGGYPTGDTEGVGCCEGTGGVGNSPKRGNTAVNDGGSGQPSDAQPHTLDDFGRTTGSGTPGVVEFKGSAEVDTPVSGDATINLEIPDGCDVAGRLLIGCVAWTVQATRDVDAAVVGEGFTHLGSNFVSGTRAANWYYRVITGDEGWTGEDDTITLTLPGPVSVVGAWRVLQDWYDDSGPDLVLEDGTTADPPAIAATGWPAATPVLYVAAVVSNVYEGISGEPTGYIHTTAGSVDATGSTFDLSLRTHDKQSGDQSEDPSAYTCASPLLSFTLAIRGSGVLTGGWGSIPAGGDAPWDGGNEYETDGTNMTFTVSGAVGLMTATDDGASGYAQLVSDDEDAETEGAWGPWASGRGSFTLRFKVNPVGDTGDAEPNTLELAVAGDGWRGSLLIHLGDDVTRSYMTDGQRGIVITQGSTPDHSAFAEKVINSNTWMYARFDTRGESIRAKLWEASASEPVDWDITVDRAYEAVEGNWFIVTFEANDGMVLSIDGIDAQLGVPPGGFLGRHIVGYGDGSAVTFSTLSPFRPGTLSVWVDNQPVVPTATNAAAGTFTLGRAPYGDPADETGSAIVEAQYEVA